VSASDISGERKRDLELEIAHLLVIDVVGYSKLLVNEQVELLQELTRLVRTTECFCAAEKKGKLIRLPTGDGMALLFFQSPEQPVQCAVELATALRAHPEIQVRMAIHSGPVNRIVDVNDMVNVAGAGINVAQRVLDCGDAGHILLSKHLADDLAQYRHWQPHLRDLGECEVKHGLRLHIFSLCKEGVGNPLMPQRLRRGHRWKQTGSVPVRPVVPPRWPQIILSTALLFLALALAALCLFVFRRAAKAPDKHVSLLSEDAVVEKSIAVLPFENLSDDKQNAYFADGVQDEILTDLAKVADLKVISRTSVMQYRNSAQRNLREIARSLGVSHILEGTVQRAGDRVRVSAQLIDARTDAHLWADRYERDLADIFVLENELAEKIAGQLKSRLSAREKAAIEEKPTSDLAAYDLYIRARILIDRAVFNEPRRASLLEAVGLLEQAVHRDPSFVACYFQLAHAHDQIYLLGFDRAPARLALADAAVQSIHRLRPDSGEAHLALAKHLYWGYFDFDRARRELELARNALPNDPLPSLLVGYIDRRQGHWDESLGHMKRALDLDPRNFFILQQIALTYTNLRRYEEVAAALDRALIIRPQDVSVRVQRAEVDLDWRGNTEPLRKVIETAVAEDPEAARTLGGERLTLALYQKDMKAAKQVLADLPEDGLFGKETISLPRAWCEGVVARAEGDFPAAQSAFDKARVVVEKRARDEPNSASALCTLGMVDAALGRKKQAIQEGRRALELLPVTKDAIDGAMLMEYLAIIYAWSDKKDAALKQLGEAINVPGYLSYGQLRLDPLWEPLRGDARFEKITELLAPK
jgi:TolB-like protein/class 3 adenylate cyclase